MTYNRDKNVNVRLDLILDCQAVSVISQNRFFFVILRLPPSLQTFCLTTRASLTYGLFFYTVNFHSVLRQCVFITE